MPKPRPFLIALLCCCLFGMCLSELEARVFTDIRGRTVRAELIDVENETITLKVEATGVIYNINISQLCLADRAYIARVQAEKNKVKFDEDVLPILQEKCFRCHSERAESVKGELVLNTRELILAGGASGKAVIPGKVEASLLYELMALPQDDDDVMPPDGKGDPATESQLEIIAEWIRDGADFGGWESTAESENALISITNEKGVPSPLSLEMYGKNVANPSLNLEPKPTWPMRLSQSDVRVYAQRIDNLVNDYRNNRGVRSAGPINDSKFVRRIYLDVIGRIPTHAEREAFLQDHGEDKRERLTNKLLNGEGYTQNFFQMWADVLRVYHSGQNNNISKIHYSEWVKDAIRRNMPYDKMAFELISAIGLPHQNGAVGFVNRDRQMPADHMANTVQTFLGIQLQCAQCHDHPFDRWNRKDFLSMQSFYGATSWGGTNKPPSPKGKKKKSGKMEMTPASDDDEISKVEALLRIDGRKKAVGNLAKNHFIDGVWEPKFLQWVKLPKDYQYKDGKQKYVQPRVLFGEQPNIDESPRRAFARWIASRDNPYFVKLLGNRLWKNAMGVGLIEPIDEITYSTEGNLPGLLNEISHQLKLMDFNVKDFLRVLYRTEVYQQAVMTGDMPEDYMDYHYSGRPLQRMTAAQIWDSLLTLAIKDPDERKGFGVPAIQPDYRKLVEKMWFSYDDMVINLTKYQTTLNELSDPSIAFFKESGQKAAPNLLNPINKKPGKGSYWALSGISDPRWQGVNRKLVRATELKSPADEYHFLRQFGQSDRKTIGSGRNSGSITQALTLLNGPMHELLSSKQSAIAELLNQQSGNGRWSFLFKSVLGRDPSLRELNAANELVRDEDRPEQMVLWALLNTREFLYIQ